MFDKSVRSTVRWKAGGQNRSLLSQFEQSCLLKLQVFNIHKLLIAKVMVFIHFIFGS